MIARYTRPEMGQIWEPQNRFQKMLDVEIAVAFAQAKLGLIPAKAAALIEKRGRFEISRIDELERTTRHDVIAFVSNVAEHVGPEAGRFVHFGLTSSDVLDTAMSLLIQDAGRVLLKSILNLKQVMRKRIREHAGAMCAGRTHGMHAEPTTFGMKLAGFYMELERNEVRIEDALMQLRIAKLSGAVGTYSSQTFEVEELVAKKLDLHCETIATQVVPRDRHAEMISSLALFGAGLERLAVELRHLQRTEVGEVTEGFARGQKGSSAMPHKKNPISAENITGCARLLRGYAQASVEDIALWHERDISHSAVERVIFPDAFILADYACDRMARVLSDLEVNEGAMLDNLRRSQGQLFSSHLLLALVDKALTREAAYAMVQKISHSLKPGEQMVDRVKDDAQIRERLSVREITGVFSGERHKKAIHELLVRVGLIEASSKSKLKTASSSSKSKSRKKTTKTSRGKR